MSSTKVPPNLDYICPRARLLFTHFAKHPENLQHLLLYGSPGSGKTSSTLWLLRQIWGSDSLFSRVCFILNAADERSLEAIRAKCIPFIEVDWRERGETRPRFLVLDECETLTESAQLALRPLLDHDPRQLCVIFLSNTLNRVHNSIRSATLRVRFNPPQMRLGDGMASSAAFGESAQRAAAFGEHPQTDANPSKSATTCFGEKFYRGDLRQLHYKKPTFEYVHKFLNQEPWFDFLYEEFASSLIFFLLYLDFFDETELDFFRSFCQNQSFEYMSTDQVQTVFQNLYAQIAQKIDRRQWSEMLPETRPTTK